ncbi:MAG: type II toxin-antitoxin system HipA family toxin YjjJ [Steroidobacteraceae bacterium]
MARADLNSAVAAQVSAADSSAQALMQSLGLSQSTIGRSLRDLERQGLIVRMGTTRGARYALARPITDIGFKWPLYRIDAGAAIHELGTIVALRGHRFFCSSDSKRLRGHFTEAPYYLQDAWPAGFMGRAIPGQFPELGLPARVADWTEEQFFIYLVRRGTYSVGDLVLGTESLDRYLASVDAPPIIAETERARAYPELADQAMQGRARGSSALGEHPKFAVCISRADAFTQMIVKFSPPRSSTTGQRWADLLRAEFHAHRILEAHGMAACRSRLLEAGDRVFLECERFDRVGRQGRRGVVSLLALDTARYGQLDSWTACADRLLRDALLSSEAARHIRFLDVFGAFIANTDRHFGNITLFDEYEGPFKLAPAYDMLPMLFAPLNDQNVQRRFEPPTSRAAWLSVWAEARTLAEQYWDLLHTERSLSDEFRHLCRESLTAMRTASEPGSA